MARRADMARSAAEVDIPLFVRQLRRGKARHRQCLLTNAAFVSLLASHTLLLVFSEQCGLSYSVARRADMARSAAEVDIPLFVIQLRRGKAQEGQRLLANAALVRRATAAAHRAVGDEMPR